MLRKKKIKDVIKSNLSTVQIEVDLNKFLKSVINYKQKEKLKRNKFSEYLKYIVYFY